MAVATKVSVGTSTTSPGPTPSPSSARCSAAVPELTATAPVVPTRAATSCSKASTSGPNGVTQPERSAEIRYDSSSAPTSGEDR